jgi:hypothetical protein
MEEQPAKISEETPLPLSSNLFLSDLNVLCLSRFDIFDSTPTILQSNTKNTLMYTKNTVMYTVEYTVSQINRMA